jgi:hypothetical protein
MSHKQANDSTSAISPVNSSHSTADSSFDHSVERVSPIKTQAPQGKAPVITQGPGLPQNVAFV